MAIKQSVPREHPLPYRQGLSKPSDSNVICSLSRRAGTTGPLSLCQKNLVDPASSHMLVSKIKPCMSQYEPLHGEIAYGSLKQFLSTREGFLTWIPLGILEIILARAPDFYGGP